jgi:hypothetical protein
MTSSHLDNLVKIGQLKTEPINLAELKGLIYSGRVRLKDASNAILSLESRFDLAYNAAHSLSLAALRLNGYRSTNRYLVFQTLPHTLGVGPEVWRVLAKCHERRNLAEYEGSIEIDEQLVHDLLSATSTLADKIESLVRAKK